MPFDAQGYLLHGVADASPLADLFAWMGQTVWFVEFVNVAVPWGELLIGAALLVGAAVRLAAFGAGRIVGLDATVEKYEIGGEAVVERYPKLRYVLG